MKNIALLVTILILVPLYPVQNWNIHTNTDYIFDLEYYDQKIYAATWGGLLEYDPLTNLLIRQYTKLDGLSDLDIRVLDLISDQEILFAGTERSGIDRFELGNFLSRVDESIGLISNSIRDIAHNDSLIFVATGSGLSIFNQIADFPFPFLYENIDLDNGLTTTDLNCLGLNDDYIFCGSLSGIDYAHLDSLRTPAAWHNLNTFNSSLPDDTINDFSISANGIAIATGEGIAVFNNDLSINAIYDQSNLLESESVVSVHYDNDENLWFSYGIWDSNLLRIVYEGDIALSRISNQEVLTEWTASELDLDNPYIKNIKTLNNNIYACSWGQGFLHFDGQNWLPPVKENCILSNIVTGLKMDENLQLWVNNGHKGYLATNKGTKGISSYDGITWKNYSVENSGLHNNNIYTIAVDQENRKWFGAWNSNSMMNWLGGLSIFDEQEDEWSYLDTGEGLLNNTISFITEHDGYAYVCSYGGTSGGVNIIDEDDQLYDTFEVYEDPDVETLYDPNYIYFSTDRMYLGCYITGLRIWDSNIMPYTDGPYWELTPFNDLHSGRIFDIKTSFKTFNGSDDDIEEVWVASTSGLFRYTWSTYFDQNGEYLWYKFGTDIKRKAFVNNQWFDEPDPEFWYIEGQERLYGSIPTFPTALFVDPFNNVWIGTNDNGITFYDQQLDTYTIYNTENTPLQSNKITAFAYNNITGILYIGTDSGLHSLNIGISSEYNLEQELNETLAFPNPFYPEQDGEVRIINKGSLTMPRGKTICNIYDLAGDLVIELSKDEFEQFSWNGRNAKGKKCSSGIYLYLVSAPSGEVSRGKIVLIR